MSPLTAGFIQNNVSAMKTTPTTIPHWSISLPLLIMTIMVTIMIIINNMINEKYSIFLPEI